MKKILHHLLLHIPPEKSHAIAQRLINFAYRFNKINLPQKPVDLFGLTFPNPVGLAAGWDKNAECVDALFRMGFGFVEVGTVTPKPQEGNPKPRLFRIPEKKALINRMGFNNGGVDALVEKLQARKVPGILGVNIGKNKETTLNNALDDYQICLNAIYPHADYIVVNISSPNTPGLRELQSETYLPNLLQGLQRTKKNLAGQYNRDVPFLIKTTVDLPSTHYVGFVQTLLDYEIDGIVISNTTVDHASVASYRYADEAGGLSGAPLRERTTTMINKINEISEGKLPIIGVGGIMSAEDALKHKEAGAQLFQIYTGFVYHGLKLIEDIVLAV